MTNIKYANELRITNIVSFPIEKSGKNTYYENSMIVKISQLYASAFILGENPSKQYETPIPKILPIKLTKDWLLKFGFSMIYENTYYLPKFSDFDVYNYDENKCKLLYSPNIDLYCCFEYVHQLQNLYFAMTGEELEYQPT